MLERDELKYIGMAVGFSLIWFLLALPFFVKTFDGNNPLLSFLLFNLGLTVILIFILKAFALGKGVPIKEALGMLIIFVSLDLMVPPYAVSPSGELTSAITGPSLMQSASDYFVGFLGQGLGIHGNLLFIFTYIIFPVLLLLLGSILVKNFVKNL